jgi:hypothetical protein
MRSFSGTDGLLRTGGKLNGILNGSVRNKKTRSIFFLGKVKG